MFFLRLLTIKLYERTSTTQFSQCKWYYCFHFNLYLNYIKRQLKGVIAKGTKVIVLEDKYVFLWKVR